MSANAISVRQRGEAADAGVRAAALEFPGREVDDEIVCGVRRQRGVLGKEGGGVPRRPVPGQDGVQLGVIEGGVPVAGQGGPQAARVEVRRQQVEQGESPPRLGRHPQAGFPVGDFAEAAPAARVPEVTHHAPAAHPLLRGNDQARASLHGRDQFQDLPCAEVRGLEPGQGPPLGLQAEGHGLDHPIRVSEDSGLSICSR